MSKSQRKKQSKNATSANSVLATRGEDRSAEPTLAGRRIGEAVVWSNGPKGWMAFRPKYLPDGIPTVPAPDDPAMSDLVDRLFALGGRAVVIPYDDPWTDRILAESVDTPARGAVRLPGAACHCHDNAAPVYAVAPERYRIQTGYGRADQIWVRHTWLLNEEGKVVETTNSRDRYHGRVLTPVESEAFVTDGW